jgi:predicted dehydrogenase
VTGVEFASVVGVLDRPEPVEHDAIVGFEMANGVVGMLHAGWRSAAGPDLAVEVLGSEATARFRGTDAELVTPTGTVEPLASEPGRHESPQAAFVEAVRSGVPGTPDGRDGRAAVAVVEAAYRSAQSGRRVEVD